MTLVNMDRETITLFDGVEPQRGQSEYPIEDFDGSERLWYGPFHCPGGDFGEHTIGMDVEMHMRATAEKKAMCLTYVDYEHCEEEHYSGSIAITEVRSAADASALISMSHNFRMKGKR